MRNLGYDGFSAPDRHYNLKLQEAMQDFQRKRGILATGNYGKLS
jgi:peptidoglycan hydrolase-like protein with peptidoglycan-binding domain